MVIKVSPIAADPLTVSVNVLVEVAGSGLNDAVTPVGSPLALSVTSRLKPPVGLMVIVLVPLLPCSTVTVSGEAVRLKFPNAFTVSVMVVDALNLPEVPLIVTVAIPAVAVLLAVRVSVLLLVAGLGLNSAVTPLGKPDAERVTLPLKPFDGVTVIVLVP
jgi:hypothetical protein